MKILVLCARVFAYVRKVIGGRCSLSPPMKKIRTKQQPNRALRTPKHPSKFSLGQFSSHIMVYLPVEPQQGDRIRYFHYNFSYKAAISLCKTSQASGFLFYFFWGIVNSFFKEPWKYPLYCCFHFFQAQEVLISLVIHFDFVSGIVSTWQQRAKLSGLWNSPSLIHC